MSSTARKLVAATTAGLVGCGALSVGLVSTSQAAPTVAEGVSATTETSDGRVTPRRLTLKAEGPKRVVADNHVRFTGQTPRDRRLTVKLQRRKDKPTANWRTVSKRTVAGEFRMRALMPQGQHVYRLLAPVPGPDLRSGQVALTGTEAPFTSLTMPEQQDSQKVLNAIANADQSVEIVVYQLGAQDILEALQKAKKRLAANNPTQPVIRVMTNNQWYSQFKSGTNYAYVSKMAKALGVGNNGVSDDGLVQFNYTANNFSLTHQKTILIDTRRPDGSAYSSADQLPDSARAIVATFNLQAFGWSSGDTGCQTNPQCTFDGASGGTPGARDFGIQVNRPDDIWEIEQVFASDFAGPTPTETNQDLGLNDPTSNLVWSNGSTGVLFPAPVGAAGAPTGALYSKAAGAYPAADPNSGVGNGSYPAPYHQFAAAAKASPQIQLGTTMGNANAVHLNTVRAATAAAKAGKPASLYIYNEEYDDYAVLDAIQDAAAAGVTVRVMMTYGSSNGNSYDFLLNTKRTSGGPVDAQVHLLPNQAPQYMYIHAKMIYADLGNNSDIAFVGSQNFSENSLLFNREAGVQLKESDGTLSDGIRQALLGAFAEDFAIDGKGVTWNYTDKKTGKKYTNVPCPAVWLSPDRTWNSIKNTLDDSGCQLATSSSVGPDGKADPGLPVVGTDFSSVESYRDTSYPYFGQPGKVTSKRAKAQGYVPTPTFVAPLDGVYSTFTPQMPQGPINPSNMMPGACQVIDQATGTGIKSCPTP